jgi:hypothetical protein
MKLLFCCLLFIAASFSYAQDIPDFGNFNNKELSLKECDFDKEADAVIFFDVASSDYSETSELITRHRKRFKILRQTGVNRANIEIPYYSKDNFEDIFNLEATTYTSANGEFVEKKLDKKVVFRQKINEIFSVLKFTLPNVQVGTIVDFKYDIIAKNYRGLKDWYFQSDIPTVLSRFELTLVPNAEFTYVVHKSKSMPIKMSKDFKNGDYMSYEMNNVPGLRFEPYMDAPKDYLQNVEFQFAGYVDHVGNTIKYMTTWKEAAKELLNASYFGKQIEKTLSNSEEIITKANTLSNSYDKMKFIYEYVKNNFVWNNISSKYAPDGIKDVLENKRGTSGEINFVLINLLKLAGVQTDPMLVSERDHGKVKTTYPLIDQFNNVVAYTTISDTKFVLDATNINTPENLIPFNILNTNAFIVNREKPEVIFLIDPGTSSNLINVEADIDSTGMITGSVSIKSYDYAKISRLEDCREGKENFRHNYFEKSYEGITIHNFEMTNTGTDSIPLQQNFNFSMPAATAGVYKLINTNLFSGLEKNPFILDNRFTDIDFGCPQKTEINETFRLPANIKPEDIPKNVQLQNSDKSITFTRKTSFDGHTITVHISLEVTNTFYTADDYPALKKFYRKLYNTLSEHIVLSSK